MSKTTYEPTDQELIQVVGTWYNEEELNKDGYYFDVRTPVTGEVVVVSSHGKFRRGIVTSVGRVRAAVVLTTPTAVKDARNGYQVYDGTTWTTSHKLNRTQAGGPVRFALIAGSLGQPEMVHGSFGFAVQPDLPDDRAERDRSAERAKHEHYNGMPCQCDEDAHPFGSHAQPHREMVNSDRDGELVEVRARGRFDRTQTIRGRIVGQVVGPRNISGFYVVSHEDDGSFQTYDQRVVFQVEESAETTSPASQESAQQPATGLPSYTNGSAVVAVLERTWDAVQSNHADLPSVVIVTGSGFIGPARWGHFRADGWTDRGHEQTADGITTNVRLGEMFVAGETLAKGAEHTVETMLHEAAHVLAQVRGIQDTSRQNRWHNQKFRTLAEEVGLEYTHEAAHSQAGFSNMRLTPGTREEYAPVIEELDRAIRMYVDLPGFLASGEQGEGGSGGEFIHGAKKPRGKSNGQSTNNVKATCGCTPEPRIIRASRKVLEQGFIACGLCHEAFEAEDSKLERTDEDQ